MRNTSDALEQKGASLSGCGAKLLEQSKFNKLFKMQITFSQSLMNYLTCQNGMLNRQLKMKVSVICMMILPILSSWTMLFVT